MLPAPTGSGLSIPSWPGQDVASAALSHPCTVRLRSDSGTHTLEEDSENQPETGSLECLES